MCSNPVSHSFDLLPLQEFYQRRDYPGIIASPQLFWTAFCHEKKDTYGFFRTSISESKIEVIGDTPFIYNVMEACVEKIRQLFAKSIAEKTPTFSFVFAVSGTGCVTEDTNPIFFTRNSPTSKFHMEERWFSDYIQPVIPSLSQSLGASCVFKKENRTFRFIDHCLDKNYDLIICKITWFSLLHFSFPIIPAPLPQRANLDTAFYEMYQKGILCDFCLIAKDGQVKVHSSFLYVYGGAVIQSILSNPCCKETVKKELSCVEWSLKTMKAFVEFIYQGIEALTPDYISKQQIDLLELLSLAHFWQIEPLINGCTNLLILSSTPKNLEDIKVAAAFYENPHLKRLSEHLSTQPPSKEIKQ